MNLQRVLIRSLRLMFTRQFRYRSTEPVKTFDPEQANVEPEFVEEIIQVPPEKLRKGNLKNAHRRILMGQQPYDEIVAQFHNTIKYKRRLLGQYGIESSGVSAGIAWPTVQDVALIKEYENVAYPKTLQEQWHEKEKKDRKMIEDIRLREAELESNMLKAEKWKKELHEKLQKKAQTIEEAQKKKEIMVAEVRRHFGYCISTKDEEFKKVLQQKEEEERQRRKDDRKRIKKEQREDSLQKMKRALRDDTVQQAGNKNKMENISGVIAKTPGDMAN